MSGFRIFPIIGEDVFDLLKTFGLRGFACDRKEYPTHVSMSSVWLFLVNKSVLRITTEMHDLKDWDEVGSVKADILLPTDHFPQMIDLPSEWRDIASIEKLVVCEDAYLQAESGIRISNSAGQTIVICNASAPYELTMAAPFFQDKFNPEHDLERYKFCALRST